MFNQILLPLYIKYQYLYHEFMSYASNHYLQSKTLLTNEGFGQAILWQVFFLVYPVSGDTIHALE